MPSKTLEFETERDFHRLYGEKPESLLAFEKKLD